MIKLHGSFYEQSLNSIRVQTLNLKKVLVVQNNNILNKKNNEINFGGHILNVFSFCQIELHIGISIKLKFIKRANKLL